MKKFPRHSTGTGTCTGRYHRVVLAIVVMVALAGMLAACGVNTVNDGSQSSRGTLTGDVVAGPTRPVATINDPEPTMVVPNREVSIDTTDGTLVTTTTTDAQGHFSVALAPGTYVVQVKIVAGMVGMRQKNTPQVTILAGQTVNVRIELDTGIR